MQEIPVVYEDENIILINKPAGLVSTPGPGHPYEETLAGWVRDYVGESILEVGQEGRWGVVHRLDKDTSGIMVVVKTPLAYRQVRYQFRKRMVFKAYWTLVWGEPEERQFVVDAPVGRNPENKMRLVVIETGKPAVTKFKVLENNIQVEGINSKLALLVCFPVTGRTHQIRVHLKALGHPVFGDPFYSGRRKFRRSEGSITRPFLHANKLGLFLPTEGIEEDLLERKGIWRQFEAPLPQELQSLLRK